MDLGLKGKIALVTGASRGIGRATAMTLAREGVDLVLCARGAEGLERVVEDVRRLGRRAVAVPGDVGVQRDRERLAEVAIDTFGRVDCLVSNASNHDPYWEDEVTESSLWDIHYNVDVLGAVRLTELLIPGMRERGSGAIVFVSSISGKMGEGKSHGFGAMKAALIAAGKTLAAELARDGIRVNVVAPGTISEPDGLLEHLGRRDPELVRDLERSIPSGRFGRTDEVASCIVFVLSEPASWVVGHCLVVDGGQYPAVS